MDSVLPICRAPFTMSGFLSGSAFHSSRNVSIFLLRSFISFITFFQCKYRYNITFFQMFFYIYITFFNHESKISTKKISFTVEMRNFVYHLGCSFSLCPFSSFFFFVPAFSYFFSISIRAYRHNPFILIHTAGWTRIWPLMTWRLACLSSETRP